MRVNLLFALAIAGATCTINQAWACKMACDPFEGDPGLRVPAVGATDVPLDVMPVVQTWWSTNVTLETNGQSVPSSVTVVEPSFALFRVVPDKPLDPSTTYVLNDVENEVVLGEFTTGEQAVGSRPPAPEILQWSGSHKSSFPRPKGSISPSCEGAEAHTLIEVDWVHEDPHVITEMAVHREGRVDDPEIFTYIGDRGAFGWEACMRNMLDLGRTEEVDVQVRAVNGSGLVSDWSSMKPMQARQGCSTVGSTPIPAVLLLFPLALLVGRRSRRDYPFPC